MTREDAIDSIVEWFGNEKCWDSDKVNRAFDHALKTDKEVLIFEDPAEKGKRRLQVIVGTNDNAGWKLDPLLS